jgi:hypothetical protein
MPIYLLKPQFLCPVAADIYRRKLELKFGDDAITGLGLATVWSFDHHGDTAPIISKRVRKFLELDRHENMIQLSKSLSFYQR